MQKHSFAELYKLFVHRQITLSRPMISYMERKEGLFLHIRKLSSTKNLYEDVKKILSFNRLESSRNG